MGRKDVHRPSEIKPEDYEYIASVYEGSDPFLRMACSEDRKYVQQLIKEKGYRYSRHEHGGVCMCCGCGNVAHISIYLHVPTQKLLRIGWICSSKMEIGDENEFKKIKSAWLYKAGKAKAEWYFTEELKFTPIEKVHQHDFLRNLFEFFVRYGYLSESQIQAAHKVWKFVNTPPKPKEVKPQAPEGKDVIRGKIISIKWWEPEYPSRFNQGGMKCTVRDDKGWMGWFTLPSAIDFEQSSLVKGRNKIGLRVISRFSDVQTRVEMEYVAGAVVGDWVEIKATWTPSNKDNGFAFGKRPTVVKIVPKEVENDCQS